MTPRGVGSLRIGQLVVGNGQRTCKRLDLGEQCGGLRERTGLIGDARIGTTRVDKLNLVVWSEARRSIAGVVDLDGIDLSVNRVIVIGNGEIVALGVADFADGPAAGGRF